MASTKHAYQFIKEMYLVFIEMADEGMFSSSQYTVIINKALAQKPTGSSSFAPLIILLRSLILKDVG